MYQLFIDIYIYVFFKAQVCESPSYCNHIYIYNLYTNIYMYQLFIDIYIYMPCTVSRATTPSPSLSSNRPLGLPSGVDRNNLTKLVRLSYNDWSLCSASVNQIQSLCLFSNKAWSGSAFTLKDLSVLLLQRSQFLSEMMTKGPKARSHRRSYGKYYQIQEVVQKETMFREKTTMFWKTAMFVICC